MPPWLDGASISHSRASISRRERSHFGPAGLGRGLTTELSSGDASPASRDGAEASPRTPARFRGSTCRSSFASRGCGRRLGGSPGLAETPDIDHCDLPEHEDSVSGGDSPSSANAQRQRTSIAEPSILAGVGERAAERGQPPALGRQLWSVVKGAACEAASPVGSAMQRTLHKQCRRASSVSVKVLEAGTEAGTQAGGGGGAGAGGAAQAKSWSSSRWAMAGDVQALELLVGGDHFGSETFVLGTPH